MINTAFIREWSCEKRGRRDAIAAGTSQYGMQTFDQSLWDLFRQTDRYETALENASNADDSSCACRSSIRHTGRRSAEAFGGRYFRIAGCCPP
jgi:Tfp pilus assembly ATPase PilU